MDKKDPMLVIGVQLARSDNRIVALETQEHGVVTYEKAKEILEEGTDINLQSTDGNLSTITIDKNGHMKTVADGDELNNLRGNWDLKTSILEDK